MDNRELHFLVVDDDDVDVMNVRRAFEKNRITNPIHVASNGLEALAKLRDHLSRALHVAGVETVASRTLAEVLREAIAPPRDSKGLPLEEVNDHA